MRRTLGILTSLLALGFALPVEARESVRSVGFTAGMTLGAPVGGLSGTGLSVRHLRPDGWGWRVGGGFGTSWPAEGDSPGWLYDLGVVGTRTIAQLDWGRLYGLSGVAVYQLDPSRPAEWALGGGIGFELGASDGLSLALDIPLAFVPSTRQALPAPALSLYYNWSEAAPGFEAPAGVGLGTFRRQGLGFSAGAGGLGAAYRAWHENGWGGGVTGIAFGNTQSFFASVGGSLNRLLIEAGQSRLYATGATCAFSMFNSRVFLAGAGLGIEYGLAQGANFNIELVQALYLPDLSFVPVPSLGLTFYY